MSARTELSERGQGARTSALGATGNAIRWSVRVSGWIAGGQEEEIRAHGGEDIGTGVGDESDAVVELQVRGARPSMLAVVNRPPGDSAVSPADNPSDGAGESSRPTGPGDVLTTVLPGLPVGGHLPLWHDDGHVSYWRISDPEQVVTKLGIGALARAEVDVRRYRDAFVLNERTNELFLMSRFRSEDSVNAVSVQLAPASERDADEAVNEETLCELYDWLGDVIVSASGRGEFVAVETGGWDVPFQPYVLVLVQPADGDGRVAIETRPTPLGAPVWRDQEPIGPGGQTIKAPANEATLHAAGYLVGCAVRTWSVPVSRLGLSFGPNPAFAPSD